MIKKIKIFIKSLFLKIRFVFRRNIYFDFLQDLRHDTKVIVSKKASLKVGKMASTGRNVELKVFEKGLLSIGKYCYFNNNTSIACCSQIEIGDHCSFGYNVVIVDHDHNIKDNFPLYLSEKITIGNNVWIGSNVVILKGVRIGDNSVVAAGSVVTKNIPPNTVIIQKRETSEYKRDL